MARSLALILAGVAAVAAQTTTVSVFLPMFDEQTIHASVIAADSSKTTYFINCPASADSNDCGIASGGQTIVYGPKTFALDYTFSSGEEGTYKEEIGCKLDPTKDYASCSVSVSGSYDGTTTESSTAVATTGYLDLLIPVTVTAGANKLKADSDDSEATTLSTVAAPASTTGSADATATESGSSSDSTSAAASGSSASGSSAASATSTPTTVSGNAAGAMVTQNAVLVGAAALVGGAAMFL